MPSKQPRNRPELPSDEEAIGRFRDALAYVEAAKVIVESTSGDRVYAAPVYFLTSHAIELLLKAYLVAQGTKPSALWGKKIGHNLARLMELATEKGFVPYDDRFPRIVELLDPFHNEQQSFRYFGDGGTVPAQADAVEIVSMTARGLSLHMRSRSFALRGEADPMLPPPPDRGD